jgi:hypothetical protein
LDKTTTLIKKYDRLLSQHPGKWVAISHNKVIATAESIEDLTEKIKKINDVLVAYSATASEKEVGYLL